MKVSNIARDAADEAAKITAEEGLAQVAEETRILPEESERSSGNTSDPARVDVEKAPVSIDAPNPGNQLATPTLPAPSSSLALIASQHCRAKLC